MTRATLPDPAERGLRAARRTAFAAWWRAHPAPSALRDRIGRLPVDADAASLLDAAAPLLADIGWLAAFVAAAAAPLAEDPWFEPPLRTLDHGKQHGFVLFEEARLRIAVRRIPLEGVAAHKLMPKAEGSVGFTGLVTATRVIRAGGTVLDLWRAPAAGPDFAAARAGRCRRAGQRALADGMRFTVDGRREAWTIARQTGDMLLLDATARQPGADLAIEYDAATGAYRGASATDGAVARVQLMATLLRLMGRRDASPALAACADGGPFFQRWHMARTLAALDPVAVAPLLDRLGAADPHPEVRAAATAARALIAA